MSDSWFSWLDAFNFPNPLDDPESFATDTVLRAVPGTGTNLALVGNYIRRNRQRDANLEQINTAIDAAKATADDMQTLTKGIVPTDTAAAAATTTTTAPGGDPGLKYSDEPGAATTADQPYILGYKDYPGELPASNVSMYNSSQPWTEWADMSKKDKIATKRMLYKAGYYGKSYVPVMNNSVTEEDRDAIEKAMVDANLSQHGDWRLTVQAAREVDKGGAKEARKAALQRAADRATAISNLRAYAYNNGVKLPEDFLARKANQIAAGAKGQDEVEAQLTERFVAKQYPALADDLKAGLTVREAAAPYITTFAELLEVPEAEVNLSDPLLKKALQGANEKGEPSYTPLWKFEEEVKKDKRWQYTNNAWDEVGGKVASLMQMFGVAP